MKSVRSWGVVLLFLAGILCGSVIALRRRYGMLTVHSWPVDELILLTVSPANAEPISPALIANRNDFIPLGDVASHGQEILGAWLGRHRRRHWCMPSISSRWRRLSPSHGSSRFGVAFGAQTYPFSALSIHEACANLGTTISGGAYHNLNAAGDDNAAPHAILLMDRSIRSASLRSTRCLVQSPDWFFGPQPKGLWHHPPGIAVNIHRCKRTPRPFLIIGQNWISSSHFPIVWSVLKTHLNFECLIFEPFDLSFPYIPICPASDHIRRPPRRQQKIKFPHNFPGFTHVPKSPR
jgi:hypothetical protein